VWLAGNDVGATVVYHWDGSFWTESVVLDGFAGTGIHVEPSGVVWVWGDAGPASYDNHPRVVRWDGAVWAESAPTEAAQAVGTFLGMHALSSSLWFVGELGGEPAAFRCDSAGWKRLPVAASVGRLDSVWMDAESNGWAVGSLSNGPLVMRWDSVIWNDSPLPTSLQKAFAKEFLFDPAVSGFGPNDVWVRGNLHWDGATWNDTGGPPLLAYWRTGPNELFGFEGSEGCGWSTTVGSSSLWSWVGSQWTRVETGLGAALLATGLPYGRFWAASADDVWVIQAPRIHAC